MLSVKNLNVSYYGTKALNNVSLDLPLEHSIGIIGPNGAGKSTLLKAILGIIKKDSGQVTINGQKIDSYRQQIAYVAQRSEIDLTFPINVMDTVITGTYPRLPLFKLPGKKEKAIAKEALEKVGLADLAHRQIGNLSGGQLQRVFIARALAQQADFFFLDEPFVGIDMASEKIIIDILNELVADGKTIITVHHDLNKVQDYFDHLVLLDHTIIGAGETEDVFNQQNIQSAYGQTLGNLLFREEEPVHGNTL
ncbi:metal ABC transporter ATP-binding protein [Vagococcus lutrae]|uniref:Metal ABC transporter ATP-binding protein n=1 Tax=Vagococcus lutrae TaxID=81947 RepID=A0AAE9XG70_9ENTE|nr:metal ABC transporter ATP-binding protein [Vagococcus lutrae]WCG23131.1 metal ABC transporter ATP-binding protein [Vagococcus lutrae]